MHDVLADIIAGVRVDLAAREAAVPITVMRDRAAAAPPAREVLPTFRAPGV